MIDDARLDEKKRKEIVMSLFCVVRQVAKTEARKEVAKMLAVMLILIWLCVAYSHYSYH